MNLKTILKSGDVVRFHAAPEVEGQKLSEHQWGVALILQYIYPECSKELLMAALTHDAHELFIGDIPAPAKRANGNFMKEIAAMEARWEEEHGVRFELNWQEKLILTFADTLEGMNYCLNQAGKGSLDAFTLYNKWQGYFKELTAQYLNKPIAAKIRTAIVNADTLRINLNEVARLKYGN